MGPKNVLPWVNKALVYATAQSDVAKATESCMKALEIDSNCEVAIQHLAQFKLQSNEIKEALKWYEKGIEVAMTELGLSQFIQFHVAALAQLTFMENYPEVRPFSLFSIFCFVLFLIHTGNLFCVFFCGSLWDLRVFN
jgi:tetratricopeptide (TPR) repeat protein